jgi:hypothetical protein
VNRVAVGSSLDLGSGAMDGGMDVEAGSIDGQLGAMGGYVSVGAD